MFDFNHGAFLWTNELLGKFHLLEYFSIRFSTINHFHLELVQQNQKPQIVIEICDLCPWITNLELNLGEDRNSFDIRFFSRICRLR